VTHPAPAAAAAIAMVSQGKAIESSSIVVEVDVVTVTIAPRLVRAAIPRVRRKRNDQGTRRSDHVSAPRFEDDE